MESTEIEKNLSSFDDMTSLYKRFLRIIGVLPYENLNKFVRLLHLAYCFIAIFIYWSMFLFHLINQMLNKKVPAIENICETILVNGLVSRYCLLALNRIEFAKLLDESQAIWLSCDEDGRNAVRSFERKIRIVFHFLFFTGGSSIFMYIGTTVYFTINAYYLHNDTHTKILPFCWYSENGPYLWPGYKIIFAVQIIVMQKALIVAASVDSAAPLLIMMGAGYFRALQRRFLRIADKEDDPESADRELITCVKLHQRILNLCSRIDEITRTLFSVQLLCTCYNISLAAFKLAGSDPDRYKFAPFMFFNISQLFICQWAPDHLLNESAEITNAVYSVSFIWMRRRLGKILVLVMARSQQPVQMTAAGIVCLSLENFRAMLASAASFFTVLKNFNI